MGAAAGLGCVFTGALAGGVVLHLDLPVTRRTVERLVRGALAGVFEGSVEAQEIERIGLDGVKIGRVVVRAPDGVEVIRARGVRAEASVPAIVRSALGSGDLVIDLPFVRIEEAEVLVEPNAAGQISIAAAFRPRPKPAAPPGRDVRLALDRVEIGDGHVTGKPAGDRPLDADVHRLAGSVKVEPGLVAVDVSPTGVKERGLLPGQIAGTAEYHLRVFGPKTPDDTASPQGTRMWATFGGQVGEVELVAQGLLAGDHVEVTAHAPRARPAQVKALVPAYPLRDTVAVDVDVQGDLPRLAFSADAQTESHGAAGAKGWIELGVPLRGEVTFRTEGLDPRVAGPDLPAVRVTSAGKVTGEIGAITSVRIDARTEATSLAGQPVPAAEATAVFDGFTWTGSVKAHEPGAPVQGTFTVQEGGAVRFDASAKAPSLAKVPRLGGKLGGAASVRATGVFKGGAVDATVKGSVSGLTAKGGVRVARGTVSGRVSGPLSDLAVDATVSASDAEAGGYAVDDAVVHVSGPVTRPRVSAHLVDVNDTRIDASGVVDVKAAAASRVKVRVEREGAVASGQVARIGAGRGGVAIEGVALSSPELGKVEGSLRVTGGELSGTLRAKDLDLTALRKLAALPYSIGGKVDADVALRPAKGGRKGHLRLSLREGSLAIVKGVAGEVNARFDGDRVEGGGEVTLRGLGERCDRTIATVRLDGVDGHITGPLLSAKTWAGATGRVDVKADDWDLECLAGFVPVGLPISEIHGLLAAKFSLLRDKDQRLPSVHDLKARSYYLTVVGPEGPEGEAQWASRDLDFELDGDVDARTGETRLTLGLFDEELFAETKVAASLDLEALLDPARRAASLVSSEIAATFSMPRRDLVRFRTLPTFVRDRLPPLTGEVSLDATLVGPIARPQVVVRALGAGVAPQPDEKSAASPWLPRVDAGAFVYYDGSRAVGEAQVARAGSGKQVLVSEVSVSAPIEKVLAGAAPATYLTARGTATLDAFPLADVPTLGDRAIGGHVTGTIDVEGLGEDPSLTVDLRAADLAIGSDLVFPEARVSLLTRRAGASSPSLEPRGASGAPAGGGGAGPVVAIADLALRDRQGGALDASGYVQLDWGRAFVPALRRDRPADLHARFAGFRLAAIEPFTGGLVREVGGALDGAVRMGWGRLEDTDRGTLLADLRLTNGSFYLPLLGQQLRLVGEKPGPVHITASTGGLVRVENLAAEGDTGRVHIAASAQLDGLTFRSATGRLAIAEREALPVMLGGVELGEAWGTMDLSARTSGREIAVDARSSNLHFTLPPSSRRDVQDLAPNPDITISHQPPSPEEDRRAPGRPIAVAVHLDGAVIEGSGIYLKLSTAPGSPPTFVLGGPTTVASGDVRVVSGSIEQVNRKFVVDQGSVQFQGEVGNPYINATAHWDAPDGSRLFVDYVGTLKPISRTKLQLRSNPPRSQQEILAMLLFGSETGGEAVAGTTGASQGVGTAVGQTAADLGGELAAQQLNALLGSFVPLKGLSTRLGASEAGGLKGSLVYRVGDTVTALATYEGAAPGGGASSAGAGAGASGSLTLDWRFYRNWLIRAKLGAREEASSPDRFTGTVELLWQYRY